MQVTRTRRSPARTTRRPALIAAAGITTLAVTGAGFAAANTTIFGTRHVAATYSAGIQVSDNQVIKPLGSRVVTPYGKFMGSTVSPDGRFLAATSADRSIALQVFDLKTHQLVWRAGSGAGANLALKDNSVGQEGPTWSPDGQYLWLPQKDQLTRFSVNADGTLGSPAALPLPKLAPAHPTTDVPLVSALPAKGTWSADGKTLYMALNGQNSVVAINPATMSIMQTWQVGIAPRQVVLVGKRLYVSNEGGRQALPGESTINSYGSDVPADPFLGTSTTGTLSVIEPGRPQATVGSIRVGLHPTALFAHGSTLYVANTFDDTVSVVDTRRGTAVQTIETRPYQGSDVGYEPTSLAMSPDGRLLVSLGRANAVAVYRTDRDPREPVSLVGLLPTDYFPATLATVGNQVVVTNTRGIDAQGPAVTINKGAPTPTVTGRGTHSTTASLTWFAMPDDREVKRQSATVFHQNAWSTGDVKTAGRRKAKPVAVPTRVGDPSTIKHVFLIVKENRTYDQLFGDIAKGNGDASLAQFGAQVTPNQHALSNRFGLFDNTYDIGTNSAEGHNWLMQGDDPAYTESSAGEYERSYDTEDDVLGHQRSGFLWTSVMQAGQQARNYGEFTQFLTKPDGATWQKYYCATKAVDAGTAAPATLKAPSLLSDSESPIPSLNAITAHDVPKFDTNIPDIYRYQMWKQHFEAEGPANFNMMWFSSDHTGGAPNARAQVADNDLAVGKVVQEISHSKYWKDSAIFVVEDDSQDGADHVDGHRAPVEIISPWSRGGVVHTYYSQINMVRTIQQILGAKPLNQKLAAATPMYDAFTNKPNYAPYAALANQVPLTEGVTPAPECGQDVVAPSSNGSASATAVPAAQQAVAKQWEQWKTQQQFSGSQAAPDTANPEQMNRFTWYEAHHFATPYPGDSRIYAPADVPGAAIAANEHEG